jgi:hypothetical protein
VTTLAVSTLAVSTLAVTTLAVTTLAVSTFAVSTLQRNAERQLKRTVLRLTDEHFEGCMRIATTENKPDIGRLLKPKQYQISY